VLTHPSLVREYLQLAMQKLIGGDITTVCGRTVMNIIANTMAGRSQGSSRSFCMLGLSMLTLSLVRPILILFKRRTAIKPLVLAKLPRVGDLPLHDFQTRKKF
jgi:hypothetical protein